ncbi:MAG: PilZ domain-containing protein [Candidatus Eremiobacteraeota bacterium]|nr:PilZ domain-containing protein [Candidatus Eremiobacteraeota bacterium]
MPKRIKNRRRHVRIPMINIIRVRSDQDSDFYPCMLVDLSARGARILSQFRITIGDEMELLIPLSPGEEIQSVKGKIVWTQEMDLMKEYNFGVEYMGGVEFDCVNEKIREFIENFVGNK